MLKLVKEGGELSAEDMVNATAGGDNNCGTVGCDCGDPQYMTEKVHRNYFTKQYLDFWIWDAIEY